MNILVGFLGILFIIGLVWIFSTEKKRFPFRIVIVGIILQLTLAYLVLKFPAGVDAFKHFGAAITNFLNSSLKSAEFLFGNAINPDSFSLFGFQFAIIVTCTIVFFSAFVSILYHYGIIQKVVYGMAWVMQKTLGTSGVESLSASANIFLGQTEAPLLVRHYLKDVSTSELFSIMTVGFATIAGGVLAAYVAMGIDATYLVTASIISAPGGLILSKIVIPPSGKGTSLSEINDIEIPKANNLLMAITNGATDGIMLSINIMAMLIAFIALIAIVDGGLGLVHSWLSPYGMAFLPSSFRELLGYIFMPFAFLTNIPWEEARAFGGLLGTKLAVNEFIAFSDLGELIRTGAISERTAVISTFALCGFANFSSVAIQIGGIGSLVPERKEELSRIGFKAMLVGALTNMLTATIAGILL
ncbi:MAG: NupC/NupG family nucleoside CNT transporter [Candidatus Kapabacteria bacterium]|nr:NupC/NupG family nucleoside CNT transporter [Ignavibacteriota bacterium]MCW5883853.1 NupC/NupG family nucleoside CNT transporter [Candidatus Kapabacteria bacterium]